MTRDEVIAMANEAGMNVFISTKILRDEYLAVQSSFPALMRFVALVSEKEREARQVAPHGWQLVPVGATLNMLETAFGICSPHGQPLPDLIESASEKYAALLAAAPIPSSQGHES